jgi:hypothetical protein
MVEVGKGCECAKTGKPISEKLVERLHRQDIEREEKLVSLRLKNIELRHKCATSPMQIVCHSPNISSSTTGEESQ